MDSHSIEVSYLGHFASPNPEKKTLEEIIGIVRSDRFASSVKKIRTLPKKDRGELKNQLPQFLPTVVLGDQSGLTDDAIPTGIVQFDVDVKDNEGTDFDDVKQMVITIPECIYAFKSPTGGVKFGILTDFRKNPSDSLAEVKQRFRQAYGIAHRHVSNLADVQYDACMKALRYACFLSSDPDAYFNPDCSVLLVNAECVYEPPKVSQPANELVDVEKIQEVLQFIPRNFGYNERLPVNFAVFNCIGEAGIPLLFEHWTTDNREKLRKDLKTQCRRRGYGSFAHLVNIAKKHGYTVPTGCYVARPQTRFVAGSLS